MAYSNVISRTDAQALIPEVVSNELLTNVENLSAALTMFKHVPMSTNQTRMPVVSALPVAYFVGGDTGLKQTTEVDWSNKYLNVEEIACIVPIPENVLDDVDYDAWGAIRPLIEAEVARTLDAAIFFGTNKPASWPTAIVTAAASAGNVVAEGTSTTAQGGIYGDLSALYSTVEADGFDVNGLIANVSWKGKLRNARSTQGVKLDDAFASEVAEAITYPMRGLWPSGASAAEVVAGDYSNGLLGVRKDITYKILDQAAIFDDQGALIFNLPQQDMIAMRITARYAFQVANLINHDQATEANRYPFAVLNTAA